MGTPPLQEFALRNNGVLQKLRKLRIFYLTGGIEDVPYYPLKDGGKRLPNFIENVYNKEKGFIRHEVIAHRMIFYCSFNGIMQYPA
jgi:hypothetical protein